MEHTQGGNRVEELQLSLHCCQPRRALVCVSFCGLKINGKFFLANSAVLKLNRNSAQFLGKLSFLGCGFDVAWLGASNPFEKLPPRGIFVQLFGLFGEILIGAPAGEFNLSQVGVSGGFLPFLDNKGLSPRCQQLAGFGQRCQVFRQFGQVLRLSDMLGVSSRDSSPPTTDAAMILQKAVSDLLRF